MSFSKFNSFKNSIHDYAIWILFFNRFFSDEEIADYWNPFRAFDA